MEKQSAKHQYITVFVGKSVINTKFNQNCACHNHFVHFFCCYYKQTVDLLMVGYGITCGWASPGLELLTSNDTPLPSGKISLEEASWIAAFCFIGGFIGNIVFGIVTTRYGRKWPLFFIAIPTIVRKLFDSSQ